ncbi:hypothetical protein AKJ09_01614 [Labilithrix luteola]|uniref:Uncharacterized protein n=1 Tax=Labilithrix luteola TaxID=1391654 RepID=A0A0K1PN31_9BACT|nr:hypothetical protein AKJ09_01614 [Labilithrix luteola]
MPTYEGRWDYRVSSSRREPWEEELAEHDRARWLSLRRRSPQCVAE